jgi:hypothetical protein
MFWKIKFFIITSIWASLSAGLPASKPEKVLRIVYEMHPNAWYQEQAALWKKEIEKNSRNAEAWYNYYNANRYAHFEATTGPERQAKLQKIIDEMERAIPGTYEFYLLKFWNQYNPQDLELVEKAYQLQPERADTYYPFLSHYETKGPADKFKAFCKKLYQSRDIAPWLLNYNYNVLMSTAENAILFTNGDNDTYPVWLLQEVQNIRPDVTIINISLSTIDSYLDQKLAKRGIKIDTQALKKAAVSQDPKSEKTFKLEQYLQNVCFYLYENYPDIPIYFGLTVSENFIENFKKDLYIVGLAYQYERERIDNLALLKKNLEKNFRLDYLTNDWYQEAHLEKGLMPRMHLNYAVILVMLAEHLKLSGERESALKWKNLALELARQANQQPMIDEINKKGI